MAPSRLIHPLQPDPGGIGIELPERPSSSPYFAGMPLLTAEARLPAAIAVTDSKPVRLQHPW